MSSPPTTPGKKLTWLITGCSSGFGLEFARVALSEGHTVIATSRNPSRNPELVREITTSKRGRWLQLDYSDPECGKVIEDLEAEGTEIDVLVNCAGMAILGPLETFTESEITTVMDTNFNGPFRLMRSLTPHLRRRRRGIVVNISTGSGLEARPGLGMYGASKAALDGVTKTFSAEMAEFGVRGLLVWLGSFDTPMAGNSVLTGGSGNGGGGEWDKEWEGTKVWGNTKAVVGSGWKPPGDHKKAVRVIYEVVTGQGENGGKEGEEGVIALGADCGVRVDEVKGKLERMMNVFGEACYGVGIDK